MCRTYSIIFSKGKDDERAHQLKFKALAFVAINGLIISWLLTKVIYNWDYNVANRKVYPTATLYLILTIGIAYGRLFYFKRQK